MKQSFFLWGNCLGSRDIMSTWEADDQSNAHGTRFLHTNIAYFCPVCGEVWGRVFHEIAVPWWRVDQRHCNRHTDPGLSTAGWVDWKRGSFLCPFADHADPLAYRDDLPDAVLLHEFNLLMHKLDKEHA